MIIRFKSSQDILQGVSKLDYFLKASVFQKYKGDDQMKKDMGEDSDDEEDLQNSVIEQYLYEQ